MSENNKVILAKMLALMYIDYDEGKLNEERLMTYQKAIVYACNLTEVMAELLGMKEEDLKETCKQAYEKIVKEIEQK